MTWASDPNRSTTRRCSPFARAKVRARAPAEPTPACTEHSSRPGRPALLVSATSWTADEDFGVLYDALVRYDQAVGARIASAPSHAHAWPHAGGHAGSPWELVASKRGVHCHGCVPHVRADRADRLALPPQARAPCVSTTSASSPSARCGTCALPPHGSRWRTTRRCSVRRRHCRTAPQSTCDSGRAHAQARRISA